MKLFKFLKEQNNIANEHYDKTLKEFLPQHVHERYTVTNIKLAKYVKVFLIFYMFDRLFYVFPELLRTICGIIFCITFLYFCIYELYVATYTFPNYKKWVVKNSPVQEVASAIVIVKYAKSLFVTGCMICAGGFIFADTLHKSFWPAADPLGAKLGKSISKVTGYNPK